MANAAWVSNPSLVYASGTIAAFTSSLDQSGLAAIVIVPNGSGAPSVEQIFAGQDSASGAVPSGWSANGAYCASGVALELTVSGLTSETAYDAYLAGSGYVDGYTLSGYLVDFTTADVTAPTWNTTQLGSITTTGATLTLNMDDAGSGYYVIQPASQAEPSIAKVKAGLDYNGDAVAAGLAGSSALVANTDATLTISNLQYSTQYKIYVAGTDEGGNDVAALVSATFRAAVPAPGVVSGAEQRRRRQRREQTARGISMMRGMGMR
jgi:hypothetical protein